MDNLELDRQAVSQESAAEAVEFVSEFSHELSRYKGRVTGSAQETACARAIRARLEEETDSPVRMEAFKTHPSLGRGCFYLLGIWFLVSYALYYVSFAGGRVAGILFTAVALVNFLVGVTVISLLFMGNKKLSALLGAGVSYNVVGEFSKNRDRDVKERVIIVADAHDAPRGSMLKDYGILRRLTVWLCPLSAAIFVLFCILKMAIGTSEPDVSTKVTLLSVIPAISGVSGIVVTSLHYSPSAKHSKLPNGISTCVAMATYSYFAEQPELLPDDVRVVYASFGGENSVHSGAEAFIKAHPEFADARVLCIGDIDGAELKLAEYDPIRRLDFSTQIASAVSGAAYDLGEAVTTIPHGTPAQKISQLHGYISTPFAQNGVQSATITGLGECLDENVVKRVFLLSVGTVFRLIKDIPVPKAESPEKAAASVETEIRAISSK